MGTYTTYADPIMAAISPSWLLDGFLEFGQVVLLTGPGGCGKSFLTANWAARVTRGELPGLAGEPASVGLINMEDDPNTATAWRLRAENADIARVIDLSESEAGEPAELPRDAGALRQAIDENGIKLLIIDPLSAVSSKSLTTVLQARKIIMPLLRAARETGCCIVIVHHVTKAGTVAGSKGLVDSVRRTLTLERDEQVPADRVLSVGKTNGTTAAPMRFTIEGDGNDAHLSWLDREVTTQRRTSWRDDLAARRAARQGGGTAAGPLPAAVPVSAPPKYSAAKARPGQRGVVLVSGATAEVARMACEATPEAKAFSDAGYALEWKPDGRGGMQAWAGSCGFVIAPAAKAAVRA